jgi:hypothetical protein
VASKSANTTKSGKPRKIPVTAWKPGQSGNPAGRPPDGESWSGVLRWAAELTGEQAAKISPPELSKTFSRVGKLKLKQAVTLRTFAAMLSDPTSGLFNAMMDRAEGKVPDKLQIDDWRADYVAAGGDPDALINNLFAKVEIDDPGDTPA